MKKLLISTIVLTTFALVSAEDVVTTTSVNATTQTTGAASVSAVKPKPMPKPVMQKEMPKITSGDQAVDEQVKALRKELEDKVKALRDEYEAKIKVIISGKTPMLVRPNGATSTLPVQEVKEIRKENREEMKKENRMDIKKAVLGVSSSTVPTGKILNFLRGFFGANQ